MFRFAVHLSPLVDPLRADDDGHADGETRRQRRKATVEQRQLQAIRPDSLRQKVALDLAGLPEYADAKRPQAASTNAVSRGGYVVSMGREQPHDDALLLTVALAQK